MCSWNHFRQWLLLLHSVSRGAVFQRRRSVPILPWRDVLGSARSLLLHLLSVLSKQHADCGNFLFSRCYGLRHLSCGVVLLPSAELLPLANRRQRSPHLLHKRHWHDKRRLVHDIRLRRPEQRADRIRSRRPVPHHSEPRLRQVYRLQQQLQR